MLHDRSQHVENEFDDQILDELFHVIVNVIAQYEEYFELNFEQFFQFRLKE